VTRVLAPLGGLLLTLALFAASRGLDDVAREGTLGPGFWPRLVLSGLALACLGKLAGEWRRRAGADAAALVPISHARLVAAVALILLYALATPAIGFALASVAFIAAFMALAGARSPLVIAANALGGTVVLLYTFVKLVYLPLPKGGGPFETVTLALYRALRLF
jgi:putative tricarboxylic transport membrane protein